MTSEKKERAIVVGAPDVDPSAPSHVPGVAEGNWPSRALRKRRAAGADPTLRGDGSRSTGIAAEDREPIDPRMPKLPPP